MSLLFYMDHHVRDAVTSALRLRSVDVLTALEDGANQLPDPQLLDRATVLGRVLFSQDKDLLREAARRQRSGEAFAGLVFSKQTIPIARCIDDRELLALTHEPNEFLNRVEYLPI